MFVLRNILMALHSEGRALQVFLHGHIIEISGLMVCLGSLVSMTEKTPLIGHGNEMFFSRRMMADGVFRVYLG